jgi:hypothetical protein
MGQSFNVHFTAPPGRRVENWPVGDAIALHNVNQRDDVGGVVPYSRQSTNGRTDAYVTVNTAQDAVPAGTYTADYVTLDTEWLSWRTHPGPIGPEYDRMRAIWRGAKSSRFTISNICPP